MIDATRRLLPYYRPYWRSLTVGLASVVCAAAVATAIPALLRDGINHMHGGADRTGLWRVAGLMLGAAMLSGTLRFLMRQTLNGISRRIETDLRHDIVAHLTTLDATWFGRWRTGDLMARLTNDLSAVRMAAGPAIMYLLNTVAGGCFALAMMLRISPSLTGAALIPLVGLPVLMIRLGRRVHQRFEAVQSLFSDLSTRAQENLAGVRVVRAYRQEAAEANRFDALGGAYVDANMRLARLNGLMNPGFALLAGIGGAVVVAVGGRQLIAGQISVGDYVAFGIYLTMLTWPMIALGWTTNLLQRGSASMRRLIDLLDAVPDIPGPAPSATLPSSAGGRSLEFRHVWFQYPTRERDTVAGDGTTSPADDAARWVLRDVSFRIPAGGTLAIVGATGSGKSALMDLIPRLFDPQRGEILLDGVPITTLPLDALRAEIGYVPQESLLFSDTIGTNVAYGIDPAHAPASRQAAVADATRIAQLAETIAQLPAGLDSMLGERGINLSGGQKQRTALARALARYPHVVLLDDALSAVDTQTEAAILTGLRDALARRTAVIASHRISAVRDADCILVLENGAVVEQGRHADLMAHGGRYAQLLHRQQLLESIEAA